MSLVAVFAGAFSASLTDPPTVNPLAAAVQWLEGLALGSIATSVALIAVAAIGMMMLSGRVPIRRGASVLLGCFILFGAQAIAKGIQTAATYATEAEVPTKALSQPTSPSAYPAPRSPNYDPYAGAAVPTR